MHQTTPQLSSVYAPITKCTFSSPNLSYGLSKENLMKDESISPLAIGNFRVSPGLCIKTRLSAQPLIWKWFFILMQIKFIFTREVVLLASFWKWGFLEFGSGLLLYQYWSTFLLIMDWYLKEKLMLVTLNPCTDPPSLRKNEGRGGSVHRLGHSWNILGNCPPTPPPSHHFALNVT